MATKFNNSSRIEEQVQSQIRVVSIDSIKLWPDNPRKNDIGVPKLCKILKEHGQRSPIVVWDKNGIIYKGNTTWKAAKKLGWTTIQVLYQSFTSEAAAVAYGIADNKSSEWSDWDDEILSKLMKTNEAYFGGRETGFTEKELNALKMHSEMPDKLEAADLLGDSEQIGDFLVLQFGDPEDFQEFKTAMGLGKQERTLLYSHLREFLR